MAIVRKSLNEIMASEAHFDREKMQSTSDEDILRQIAEDPDTAPELTLEALSDPANLRRRLGMTQERFADALGVPISTVRKWEAENSGIDPAARSLLILLARDPDSVLAALAAARAAA